MNKPSDNIVVYYSPYPNTALYLDKSYTKKLSAEELSKALQNEKNLFQVIAKNSANDLQRAVLYDIQETGTYFSIAGPKGLSFKLYK